MRATWQALATSSCRGTPVTAREGQMKANQISKVFYVPMLSLVISSCGPGQVFGPTLTPVPTFTATPFTATPISYTPKEGYWEGGVLSEDGFDVEFYVTRSGEIDHFYFVKKLDDFTNCLASFSGVDIESTGSFFFDSYGFEGGYWGAFDTPETASGIVTIRHCMYGVEIVSATGDYAFEWFAKWIGDK
jgi:hypothetical protein